MTTKEQKFKKILSEFVTEPAIEPMFQLIQKHRVHLSISKTRKTKHGDFRPAVNGNPHRISVNHDLNPYAFFITFLHELAHQIVWVKYKNRVNPHGKEWKEEFYGLIQPFLSEKYFPPQILKNLNKNHSSQLQYSTSTDTELARSLKSFDSPTGLTLLEKLPEKKRFMLPNGMRFEKNQKRRKNYLCLCLDNGKNYIFNPLAEVIPLEEEDIH